MTSRKTIFLELNGEAVKAWKRLSCTTAMFYLPQVWRPQSEVICKLNLNQLDRIVSGSDLKGGCMYTIYAQLYLPQIESLMQIKNVTTSF